MTVPLLRVCYHCGYPTPGRHATSCRDADSGVVEVAKPPVPAQVAQQIRDVEAQRDGLAELLKGAVEAGERLRQELDEARAERDAARFERDQERHGRKVNEYGLLAKLRDAEAERDRMRAVLDEAETWRWVLDPADAQRALASILAVVDAYRVATPDAEPAPGVPEPQVDESPPETVDLMAALRASLERAKAARAGKAAPGVPAVQIEPFHSGRSWFGNELEAECPCPKETCGLVDLSRAVPECTQHPITRGKTMRQGHPADQCPALPAPGVPVDTEATL